MTTIQEALKKLREGDYRLPQYSNNKIDCNRVNLGAMTLVAREEGWDLADMIAFFYPDSLDDMGGAENWAKGWKDKIILDKIRNDDDRYNPNVTVITVFNELLRNKEIIRDMYREHLASK